MAVASHKRRVQPTRRVPRTYRLTPAKLEAAKKALGVKTATAAIEEALDLVVARQRALNGRDTDKPWMVFAGAIEGGPGDSQSVDEVVYRRTRP